MPNLTPLEQEMLAAPKEARPIIGPMASIDLKDHIWKKIGKVIAKAEAPNPRRYLVEYPTWREMEFANWEDMNHPSKIIREVKPITREQIRSAYNKHGLSLSSWDARMRDFLRELGIEVED